MRKTSINEFTRRSKVAAAYDEVAERYVSAYEDPGARAEDALLLRRLRSGGYLNGRVLDVGCGAGMLIDLAGIRTAQYVGIDPSQGMVDQARRLHSAHHFLQATAEATLLPSKAFDSAIALFGVWGYLNHFQAGREMSRVLKPGGRAFFMGYGSNRARSKRRYIVQDQLGDPMPGDVKTEVAEFMAGGDFRLVDLWGMTWTVDKVPGWLAPLALQFDVFVGRFRPCDLSYVIVEVQKR